jgi:hypothetical protein
MHFPQCKDPMFHTHTKHDRIIIIIIIIINPTKSTKQHYWYISQFTTFRRPRSVSVFRWNLLSWASFCLWTPARVRVKSHFTADSQSVSQSASQFVFVSSPLCGRLTRYCFLFKSLSLEFVVLSLWGVLYHERQGLSFVSPDTSSHSHSHLAADGQSVSTSWCRAHFGTSDQSLLL